MGILSNIAYVYARTGDQWSLEAQLAAGGSAVFLKGDYALIGTAWNDENGVGEVFVG